MAFFLDQTVYTQQYITVLTSTYDVTTSIMVNSDS